MKRKSDQIYENVLLKDFSTFGIGGPARWFISITSVESAQTAFHFAREKKVPIHIVGKGSNSLFDDKGFNGLVILNKIDYFQDLGGGLFSAGGGYSFSLLGVKTARKGFCGLEFASGIPASVGGAIFMNAGANGSETKETLTEVSFLTNEGQLLTPRKEELKFSYRHSSFHEMEGMIIGAKFQLSPSEDARKRQLEIISYRQKTQPYGELSCGCVFRNPERAVAGALIDEAKMKGSSIGGAKISTLHGNFIVNDNNATAKEVKELIEKVQEKIEKKTGYKLETEIRYIPYDKQTI